MKTKIISLFSFFFLFTSVALNADESALNLAPSSQPHASENLVAASSSSKSQMRNTWTPYFYCMSALQPRTQTFVQVNVGTGFLYFAGVRGNLQPGGIENQTYLKTQTPLQRRFNYNRTPLYEAIFGYQFNNWFKAGISFQSQANVVVSSDWQITQRNGGTLLSRRQFLADVTLYGLAAKVYFNFPYALVWKMMTFNPFVAVGAGPAWQTWTRIAVQETSGTNNPLDVVGSTAESTVRFNQKISANCMFITDIGVSSTWLVKQTSFTLIKGIKFNIWGQARSMGKASQQQFVAQRNSLSNPLRIRTVYQFAPYLGLQWNF